MDGYSLAEDPSMGCSQFKKGLMEDLKRPYDSRELATLKENVSRRKPVLRDRVMRKSTKSYPVEHKRGKSYLDLYSGLFSFSCQLICFFSAMILLNLFINLCRFCKGA